jgi:hypothetical protein
MNRAWVVLIVSAVITGCSGRYVLTVPDQVAPAGGTATAVVRLQRSEVGNWTPGVKGAPIRFRVAGGTLRATYSDKSGYAGAAVPMPAKPGQYEMNVDYQDRDGTEIATRVPAFAWDPSRKVVAVDLDCLPINRIEEFQAHAALTRLAAEANIIYLTRQEVPAHERLHERLRLAELPDGPILPWQREQWHVVHGPRDIPLIAVEPRLVSQLPELRKMFPNLKTGICDSELAAKAFAGAGLSVILVGQAKADVSGPTRYPSWEPLAKSLPK